MIFLTNLKHFLDNLNKKLPKKTLILGITIATILALLAISGLIYLQNQKFQKSENLMSQNQSLNSQNSAQTDCQKQNGRYLFGSNGFECIFFSTSSSQSSSQSSSLSYSEIQIQEKLENEKAKQIEITKINDFKTKFGQIDLSKNPKPWLLFDDELIDNNNQKIIQIPLESKVGNTWNNKWLKPILTKENKLYFPFWVGQIAVIDLQSGKVSWQDLGFEIKDLSLFNGKYFATSDCTYDNRNCSIFQIDRINLQKKKILDKDYYRKMGAVSCEGFKLVFANSEYFWMEKECYDIEINKYKIENGEFIEGFSIAKLPIADSTSRDYSYEITKYFVDFGKIENKDKFFDKNFIAKNSTILLTKKVPKNTIETKIEIDSKGVQTFVADKEKLDQFYKPADDFWQKLFPFDTFPDKMKAGQCGKFSWILGKNGDLEVKFDGLKIDETYENLQCIN